MTFNIFNPLINKEKYFIVKYFLKSKTTLRDAAWNVAIGQSQGNPNSRSIYETDELFEKYSCIVLHEEKELLNKQEGEVYIAFPNVNIDLSKELNLLMCFILGGNLDIDIVEKCQVKDIIFNKENLKSFKGPKFGMKEIRKYCGVKSKALVGSIIKPKTGLGSKELLEIVKELVKDTGISFIKEDEILSGGGNFAPLEERVPLISNYLKDKKVLYHYSITADPTHLLERVKLVHQLGGNAVHFNIHSGLGAYASVRELDLPMFIHFQKSGDKLWTNPQHNFHIDFSVICKLVTLAGVSFGHIGMWGGGYLDDDEFMLEKIVKTFNENDSIPAFSCGLHPGIVQKIIKRFGNDILLNSGGNVMSHPLGPKAGVKALVQAVNDQVDEKEYKMAIEKWGLKN